MKRFSVVLLALPLLFAVRPACAQDGIQNVAYFYPLRTRRPVIERELEIRVEHAKGRGGRTTEAAAALELPILPRWQVEIEVPAAVGWRVSQRFTPLLELVTVTRTRAAPDDELRHRTRVSLVPGFNAGVLPGSTFRFGVELPVTRARAADYTLPGGFVKEF